MKKKSDQQRLKEIHNQIQKLFRERSALQDKVDRETLIPKKQKLIGKTYKYQNNYSSPGTEEYWWVYAKVIGVKQHGDFVLAMIQKDCDGLVRFEHERWSELSASFISIPMSEFTAAVVPIIGEINSILP